MNRYITIVARRYFSAGLAAFPSGSSAARWCEVSPGARVQAGVHFQVASGYTGQTTEVLAVPGEGDAFERVVGVYIPSYATVSATYYFGR